jgi:hypothetical protein
MATITVVSSSLLARDPKAYQPLFAPRRADSTTFFDEGLRLAPKVQTTATATGSIDTEAVDAWVQGVEITRLSQYDAGIAKVWSGEAGHIAKPSVFGQSQGFFPKAQFSDADRFSSQQYVNAQAKGSPLWTNNVAFPLFIGDHDQLEGFNFNHIIEPLTIRAAAGLFSTDAPVEARSIKGTVMGGNSNQVGGSDRVLSVDTLNSTSRITAFLDLADSVGPLSGSRRLNGYFQWKFATLLPFVDARYNRNTIPSGSVEDATLVEAMDHMTGSTDNYLRLNQRSATCGWDYDSNVALGTDSLAFGGMLY